MNFRDSSSPTTTNGNARSTLHSANARGATPKSRGSGGTKSSASRIATSAAMPAKTARFVVSPARSSDWRSVRHAKTLPTCAATMPASVIVVARV